MTELEKVQKILQKLGKKDYELVRGYINKQQIKLMEAQDKVKKLNIDDVSNCCPNCDSFDIEISKRCNECSAHFD